MQEGEKFEWMLSRILIASQNSSDLQWRERPLFIVEPPQIQRYRSITSTVKIKGYLQIKSPRLQDHIFKISYHIISYLRLHILEDYVSICVKLVDGPSTFSSNGSFRSGQFIFVILDWTWTSFFFGVYYFCFWTYFWARAKLSVYSCPSLLIAV